MDRRRFLQNAAVTTAALHYFPGFAAGAERDVESDVTEKL